MPSTVCSNVPIWYPQMSIYYSAGCMGGFAQTPKSQIHVLLPPDTVMVEEFANLKRDYPGRSKSEYLDLGKMRRFPDDLPRRWNKRLPEHWRKDAGKRPDRPEE